MKYGSTENEVKRTTNTAAITSAMKLVSWLNERKKCNLRI